MKTATNYDRSLSNWKSTRAFFKNLDYGIWIPRHSPWIWFSFYPELYDFVHLSLHPFFSTLYHLFVIYLPASNNLCKLPYWNLIWCSVNTTDIVMVWLEMPEAAFPGSWGCAEEPWSLARVERMKWFTAICRAHQACFDSAVTNCGSTCLSGVADTGQWECALPVMGLGSVGKTTASEGL